MIDEKELINFDVDVLKIINIYENHYIGADKNWRYNPPPDKAIILYLILEGEFYFCIDGNEYVAQKNNVIFKNSMKKYSSRFKNESYKYLAIHFLTNEAIPEDYIDILCQPKNTEHIVTLFKHALKMYERKDMGYLLKIKSTLYDILNVLFETKVDASKLNIKHPVIIPSILYLEKNIYNSSLDIEAVAAQSKITSTYFRNIFKKIYGISPVQYINNKRLEKAVDLLLGSNFNINQIADSLGYNSTIYFDKIFKNKYGMSPNEYRKSNI